MIKTLRITSVIAAIAATILLILPAVYGVRSDPKIEEFLKSPGVVEKFVATKGQNSTKKDAETSPLVKYAINYSQILNPPPPPPPKVVPGAQAQGPAVSAPPVPVATKFDIVATSYYASHPEQSLVLIDEAGKGLHWVKQGATVGRVTIETVKDGAIVVRDGTNTSEMNVKVQETWRGLLKNPPPSKRPGAVSTSPAGSAAAAPTNIQGVESPTQPSPASAARQGAASIPARRSIRPGTTSPAGRITSPAQPGANTPVQPVESTPVQQAPAVQTQPAAEITPPAEEEKPAREESQAIKEKQAKIDKLLSETGSGEMTKDEEKKLNEVYKEIEELGKMREAEGANDVNAKDVNK